MDPSSPTVWRLILVGMAEEREREREREKEREREGGREGEREREGGHIHKIIVL